MVNLKAAEENDGKVKKNEESKSGNTPALMDKRRQKKKKAIAKWNILTAKV